ncbi:hypothetical protein SCATT_p04520 (plasmid) [Streptantibioticus cattleyicolor NRRL 8057 = DSM 46488]|uniref:Uncharacterized protein n=1 Tax=Streptantibioticus cattleyicolor (strain ATCC 35852 / DSM 46488 / JCM 4925 / NBRC 14057 / NRRL 8057) TaxID=1003195 RepID=G8XG06_STREN|nr:hypothetical protein SCATT_p04520 [Streptantibioticus cattleyicolor NRRL 8057 = DSM 46488]
MPCGGAPGGGDGVVGLGQGVGPGAGQPQRGAEVDVERGAAQRGGQRPGDLSGRAARQQPAGTGLPERDDRGAGGAREVEQAGAERAGRRLGGVPAARQTALRIDQHRPPRVQRRPRRRQRPPRPRVVPVHRHVALPCQHPPQHRHPPQPGGGQHHRPHPQPVQRGQHHRWIRQRGVVGDHDGARRHHGARVGRHRQPPAERHHGTGDTTEHDEPPWRTDNGHHSRRSAPAALPPPTG